MQLPTTLLITDVRNFASSLREAIAQGDVQCDTSGLTDIDTAGLQLLYAARQAATAAGRQFHWQGDCSALKAAARMTGLSEALGLAA